MIVYGDAERIEAFGDVRASVMAALERVCAAPAGLPRHQALVAAFVRAGELVQGVADAEFEAYGREVLSPAQTVGAALMSALARQLDAFWSSGFAVVPDMAQPRLLLANLECTTPIRTRTCEGYAHYALYPESYLEAARRSGLDRHTCVIGIRSIGVGLAALVAAALDAAPALSLRPAGHPFEREIRADPHILAAAAADPSVRFAVVDEGPGLSGSSFAAVARWLRQRGVAADRINFFPSHAGEPGPQASPDTIAIWAATPRHVAAQDDILLRPNGLRSWASGLLGCPVGPLREVDLCDVPRDSRFERRKFLARAKGDTWLLKFAGLGATGARRLRDAALLAEAGFIPEVAGLCHGFLAQRWVEGRPLNAGLPRATLLQHLAAYLAFRARSLPAECAGAPLDALRGMAVHNAGEACGSDAGAAMQALLRDMETLEGRVRPVRIDGRLHRWEWIEADGRLLKADAVDHCEGHDLVGCQDIAWDVAGASVEHELTPDELALLRRAMARLGAETDDGLIEALIPCYLAFQLGLWAGAPAGRRAAFYEGLLRHRLSQA